MSVKNPVILYDGVCGLCSRMVRFVLQRDRSRRFRFASLQSPYAAAALQAHGKAAAQLEAMCVVAEESGPGQLLCKSDAALFVLRELGWPWRTMAALLKIFPQKLRDWVYDWIARRRYRFFGRLEQCALPSAAERARFIDVP